MSDKNKLKLGRKGAAKEISEKFKKLRQIPTSQKVYDIIKEVTKNQIEDHKNKSQKKIANPVKSDVEI